MVYPCDAKELADEVLEEWDDICNELKIRHFLALGTCLGFVRDKGYIKGDNDIDVGVPVADFGKLAGELMKRGFKAGHNFGGNQHFYKHGILLDIYFGHGVKSLRKITYNEREYDIPHPVEGDLERYYPASKWGVDWRTPVRK